MDADEAFVAGAHLRSALSHSDGSQAGVHVFLPLLTLRHLLDMTMHEMVDHVVPLDALLGSEARNPCLALCEAKGWEARVALLDRGLARRLMGAAALDGQQTRALGLLRTRPNWDIVAIARAIGWSRKHLANRVRDAVGVGPCCLAGVPAGLTTLRPALTIPFVCYPIIAALALFCLRHPIVDSARSPIANPMSGPRRFQTSILTALSRGFLVRYAGMDRHTRENRREAF